MTRSLLHEQAWIRDFRERVNEDNIFRRKNIVIPIKTNGMSYGALSRQFVSKYPDVRLPDLKFREAKFYTLNESARTTVTFVGYWNDSNKYTEDHVAICAGRAMEAFSKGILGVSSNWGLSDDPQILSMPLFKGSEKSGRFIAAIESELQERENILCAIGILPCEVEIVVRDAARVPS